MQRSSNQAIHDLDSRQYRAEEYSQRTTLCFVKCSTSRPRPELEQSSAGPVVAAHSNLGTRLVAAAVDEDSFEDMEPGTATRPGPSAADCSCTAFDIDSFAAGTDTNRLASSTLPMLLVCVSLKEFRGFGRNQKIK